MTMNKKLAKVVLVTLLAPTILTTQQAIAEELPTIASTQESIPTIDSSTIEGSSFPSTTTEETTTETIASSESQPEESTITESSTVESSTLVSSNSTTETSSSIDTGKQSKAVISVPVTFVDNLGTTISATTLSGDAGATVSAAIPAGYAVASISAPDFAAEALDGIIYVTGTLSDSMAPITVTLYATSSQGAEINLVDEDGNPVFGVRGTFFVGDIGDTFTYNAPEVRGYRLVGNPVITITLTDQLQNIDVVYERITTKLTVICLDTLGKNLMDKNQVFEGKFGDTGTLSPAWFPGMKLVSVNGLPVTYPINVEFTDQDQIMTLVYDVEKVEEPIEPISPLPKPGQIEKPEPIVEPLNNVLPPVEQEKKTSLPETGEKTNSITLSVLGMTVIAGVYFTKKKRKNECHS